MKFLPAAMSSFRLINHCFNYVVETSDLLKIDESHAVKHSMEVYRTAHSIYESEVNRFPHLKNQLNVIYSAAIGHDMCDKKYMNETQGIIRYREHLAYHMTPEDIDAMSSIISTMSYSKVKANGYPKLGKFQLAYHIVREADLLAAYDVDRCVMYGMYNENKNYVDSVKRAADLFESRVFKMRRDKLFVTSYSKRESLRLHKRAKAELEGLLRSLKNSN
jgi:HD superfamily phosphodiesterase